MYVCGHGNEHFMLAVSFTPQAIIRPFLHLSSSLCPHCLYLQMLILSTLPPEIYQILNNVTNICKNPDIPKIYL